jgi:hypothetical protein
MKSPFVRNPLSKPVLAKADLRRSDVMEYWAFCRSLGDTVSVHRNTYKPRTNQLACFANATTRSYHSQEDWSGANRPLRPRLGKAHGHSSCPHPAFVLRACYTTPASRPLDRNAIPRSLLQSLRSLNRYRLFGLRQNQQTVCLQVG